jgi:intein/homing endonuclease
MEKRIYFKSKKIRKLFFKKVLEINKIQKWVDFIKKFSISRKTLDNYKNGKLTIPADFYNRITSQFDSKLLQFFEENILYRESNWGSIKGGKSTYFNHIEIFELGRKIAIEKRQKEIIKFNINMPITKELSYFIGLFIGDGFTNKYDGHYLLQFVGNKEKESKFYSEVITKISQKLFNVSPVIKDIFGQNAIRINFYSKNLFLLITNRFKIKAGRKSKEVLIPDEILNSSKDVLLSCIAGIYDAEGCFYFDKRQNYKSPYPAIALHMNNPCLIKQISNIFSKNNIKHSHTLNFSTLYIYGKANVNNFLSNIKLLNPKYQHSIGLLKNI